MLRAAIAIAFTLALAPAARASAWHYDGERDAMTNPQVAAIAAWGSSWLSAHGRRPCATQAGGTVRMAPHLGGTFYGMTLGCDVWIRTAVVARANSRNELRLWTLCVTELHELAHSAGMSHEDMASTGLEERWKTKGCVGEARRLSASGPLPPVWRNAW